MKQVVEFIENRELYLSTRSGFRTKHTTSSLLIKFRHDIITAKENKEEITIATFADSSEVFDTM